MIKMINPIIRDLNNVSESCGSGLVGSNSFFECSASFDVGIISDGSSSVPQELLVDTCE